jgi:hypothetical protein
VATSTSASPETTGRSVRPRVSLLGCSRTAVVLLLVVVVPDRGWSSARCRQSEGFGEYGMSGGEPQPLSLSSPEPKSVRILNFGFKDIALVWEGRLRGCLVGLGVVADLTSRSRPLKSVGVDIQFFSSSNSGGEDTGLGADSED